MATTSTKSRTRFVLWGWRRDDAYGPGPIRLTGGTVGQCRAERHSREKENHHTGWLLATYAEGDAPTGLRLQVREVKTAAAAEAGKARHLARLAHAHRTLYGTDSPAELPPMALAQIVKVCRDWDDPATASRLIAVDRLSQPAN